MGDTKMVRKERKQRVQGEDDQTSSDSGGKGTVVVTVSISRNVSYLLPDLPLQQKIRLPAGSNWWQLRERLGLTDAPIIWTMNGRIVKAETPLIDGAHIEITPFMEGG